MAAKLKQKKITVRLPDGHTVRKSLYYRTPEELAAKILAAQKQEKKAIPLKGFHEYGKVITEYSNFLKKERYKCSVFIQTASVFLV